MGVGGGGRQGNQDKVRSRLQGFPRSVLEGSEPPTVSLSFLQHATLLCLLQVCKEAECLCLGLGEVFPREKNAF